MNQALKNRAVTSPHPRDAATPFRTLSKPELNSLP